MKLHRIKSGKYRTDTGLTVVRKDGIWYVVDDRQQAILFRRKTLKDIRAILNNRDICVLDFAETHINHPVAKFKTRFRRGK